MPFPASFKRALSSTLLLLGLGCEAPPEPVQDSAVPARRADAQQAASESAASVDEAASAPFDAGASPAVQEEGGAAAVVLDAGTGDSAVALVPIVPDATMPIEAGGAHDAGGLSDTAVAGDDLCPDGFARGDASLALTRIAPFQPSPEGVAVLARFWSTVCKNASATLTVQPREGAPEQGTAVFRVVPSVVPPPELYDCAAYAWVLLIQALGGANVTPLEVRLPRPRRPRPERFEHCFGAPVVFEAAALELVYAHACLRTPASEHGLADDTLGLTTAGLRLSSLVAQVRARALASLAEGVPRLPIMARKLGVSARTLRRRLAEMRTSYAELVDEARRERALNLANRAELDVARLAELSGFADPSTFARAFRRWTGEGPRAFMQRVRERARGARAS